MSLSRDFRINQASALAILEAEIEAETDPLELDLPPLSETGIQPEEGEVIDTDNETIWAGPYPRFQDRNVQAFMLSIVIGESDYMKCGLMVF